MKKYYVALICLTSLPLCASDKAKRNVKRHHDLTSGKSVAQALSLIATKDGYDHQGVDEFECYYDRELDAVFAGKKPHDCRHDKQNTPRQRQRPKFNNASFQAIIDHLYGPDKDASECSTPPHEKPSSPITVPAPLTDKL